MKTLKIFLRDLKINLREFVSLWIILIPIALAVLVQAATPGITDSFLNVALLRNAPSEKAAFYERFASVEMFDTAAQIERRVMGRDFSFGLLPDDAGDYYILSQGNEPQAILDAMKLLKTYAEKGEASSTHVTFADFGRTTPPLKSTLITGLLILVTILSGMLIALAIVNEKSDQTIRAMKVAPVSATSFVVGKSLIGVVYTLASGYAILLVSGYLAENALQILLVLLASALISFVIGFLVGLTSDDFIAAAGNVKIIMVPAVAPILVTELANPKWHFLVWWSPFYWSYDAVKGLLAQTASMGRVWMDCGIVVAIAMILYRALLPKIARGLK
ncbi:MAG TPA: ABC transporter permease [Clostridia bacterium]|nr:ABC transporter permease [Clostridia bacterium]